MKNRLMKIAAAVVVLFLTATGVSFAKDWKDRGHYKPSKHAYGYYQHKGPPANVYAPRYSYHKHYKHYRHSYPVVVQKHYYHSPAYYYYPAPGGYFLGFSAYDPGLAFSFRVSGR